MLHIGTGTEGAAQKLQTQALYPAEEGAQVHHGSLGAVYIPPGQPGERDN